MSVWTWKFGVIHFHGQERLRERFYEITDDCREAGCIVDIWLNDIGKVLEEHGYTMTITRPTGSAEGNL